MKISDMSILAERLSKELKAKAGANPKPYNPNKEDKNSYKGKTSQEKTKYQIYTKHGSPNKVGP
jgi:hypothetical protein